MKILLFLALLICPLWASTAVVYPGGPGIGEGKHIVFLASDHEYRAEETCPALARILAKHHGFKCTVVFGVDDEGHLKAGSSQVSGLAALADADLFFIFTRFLDLPEEEMDHLIAYLDKGGPVVGLRTASHAFKIPADSPYAKYSFNSKVQGYEGGFGHQILGNTWVGHYGKNHVQGTRLTIAEGQEKHPILQGVGEAFCHAGAYVGIPAPDFTVLVNSQPLVSMDPKAEVDKSKPANASAWTRHYTSKDGKKHRVFHSTQGASQDLLDENYRRLIVNGTLWACGLESKIEPDLAVNFVGPFQPHVYGPPGNVRNVKPSDLAGWESPIMPTGKNHDPIDTKKKKASEAKQKKKPQAAPAREARIKQKDGRNNLLETEAPEEDPSLASFYLNLATSPRPQTTEAVTTQLPLEVVPRTRIALIGNLLLDNERRYGHLETLLHQAFPKEELTVRNLAWPADEVDLQPRPDNFADLDQHLHYFKADLIVAAFGTNESFAGPEGLSSFRIRLEKALTHLKTHAYNGKTGAQIVLLSPTPHVDIEGVPAARMNNGNLALYSKAMKEVAARHGVAFVDHFEQSQKLFAASEEPPTSDGSALNATGHQLFAQAAFEGLFGKQAPPIDEGLRALVVDKATQFFYRYRPLNTYYYTGARNKSYGYLDFLPAMRNFDLMVANRDQAIWKTAAGTPTQPDDSNLPKMDEVLLARGANEWLSPEDELKAFEVDPRFEVNLFASEEDFPELACPIQMRWDERGRMWVSCSTTYPHVYPGQRAMDKLIILEDTDGDGKADKCTTFADDLHIPLSFALDGKGGVYLSEEPHLTYLQDLDGDDRADTREILFTGFGCEDSHHALHDFTWTPGGDLLFREAIFHNSQVETSYGPIRAKNSSWFLYHPSSKRLTAFGAYPNTNPWGVTFDDWGNHVASHPVFASTFHATNPPYPEQHPRVDSKIMQAYSGTCGQDFVDFPFWPQEMQGGYLKARYKPTNKIEIHKWVEKEDHFAEEFVSDLIFSTNLSFIPVDLRFGPRGAAYVCDWYNPVKGHAQYSLRDPRRDRKAGRIWRIVPKGAQLAEPPQLEDASIAELLDNLKSAQYRTRYWSKRELRSREPAIVNAQLSVWLDGLDEKSPRHEHHLLEALWLSQGIDSPNLSLLKKLASSSNPHAAAAALGPVRFWHEEMGNQETVSILSSAASHPSQHVRREAVIAASYVGTPGALEAVLPVLDQEAGLHLTYAIQSSFGSANLLRHWEGRSDAGEIEKKLKALTAPEKKAGPTESKAHQAFDQQKGLQTLEIGCIPERLLFTKDQLTAKAGQPVKLIFNNPDATAHNFVLLAKDTPIEEIGEAANEMAKDRDGAAKHFIPEDKRILQASKLLAPGESETLRFVAPKTPGTYPYLCTFPGHWIIMKGELMVE
ncbi:PVC-type heme-binding CxxCH protein [Roseibacillus persicicus]|uniref:PVC-type heme-binding CxxCH protein n=1 Tax=Roseibacillus persicicus TaxID=454148 RepID=UPI00398AFB42